METISASEFEANCRDILDRLGAGELDRLVVTKSGRPVAILMTPGQSEPANRPLHGVMRGSVVMPDGVDLTDPTDDEPSDAAQGHLHR